MRFGKIEVEIPEDWEDLSLYTFAAPRAETKAGPRLVTQGFRTNVVMSFGPRGKAAAIDDEIKLAIQRAEQTCGPIKPAIGDGPSIAGKSTKRISYQFVEPGGTLALAQIQYLTIMDGTLLTISFTTASLEAKNLAPMFDEIASSLRVS